MPRRILNLTIGLLLGGLFLWYLFHDLDLDRLGRALGRANYLYILPYLACVFVYHSLRITRWHVMLTALHPFGYWRVFQITSVGFLAIILLPFRIGELVRPYSASEGGEVRMSSALATVMVERAVDGIVLTLLFFALTMTAPHEHDPRMPVDLAAVGGVALVLFSGLLGGMLVLLLLGQRAVRLARRLGGLFGEGGARLAGSLAESFLEGLRVLRGARRLGAFLLLTGGYWCVNGIGAYLLFGALAETATLPVAASFTVMAVLGVAVMIPNLPGFVGAFQIAVFVALLMFDPDIEKETAMAFSFLMHGSILVVLAACGFPFIISGRVSFVRTGTLLDRDQGGWAMTDLDPKRISRVLFLALVLILLAGSAAARSERKLPYDREEVFRCFIRLLRVDLDLKIHEKDLDGGFVLFEYRDPIYKRTSPASLEIVEILPDDKAPDKGKAALEMKVKLFMEIKRAGGSDEIGLLDKLETKLKQDYGRR